MRVHYGFNDLPVIERPVVTIGSYDGVHAGHRQLLERIMVLAAQKGGESVVMTFSPHPRTVLEKCSDVKLLTSLDEKITILDRIGIDHLIVIPFDKEFSNISSYDFVREYLVGKVGISTLVVGYDHHFGHNKEGDFGYLDKLKDEFGFEVYMIREHEVRHHKVSSTEIRKLISAGEMRKASELLGYDYFMYAASDGKQNSCNGGEALEKPIVDSGMNVRINIVCVEPLKLLPPAGEYEVTVYAGKQNYSGTLGICSGGGLYLTLGTVECLPEKIIVVFT